MNKEHDPRKIAPTKLNDSTVCENFDLGEGCLIYPWKMPVEYFILETFILPNCYRHLFLCAYMCRFRIFPGMGVGEITLLTKGVFKAYFRSV